MPVKAFNLNLFTNVNSISHNRHFLKLLDYKPEEIKFLLDLAADLKKAKKAGTEKQYLKGKNIALIFEKSSTRTRCAFEVAAFDQGALVTYLGTQWFTDWAKRIDEGYCKSAWQNVRWYRIQGLWTGDC